MPNADGEVFIKGNIVRRDTNSGLFNQSAGFDAFLQLEISPQAIVVETGALTPLESANIKLIPALL
jgi:hypothetical protein